jgi:hypothetical protein
MGPLDERSGGARRSGDSRDPRGLRLLLRADLGPAKRDIRDEVLDGSGAITPLRPGSPQPEINSPLEFETGQRPLVSPGVQTFSGEVTKSLHYVTDGLQKRSMPKVTFRYLDTANRLFVVTSV